MSSLEYKILEYKAQIQRAYARAQQGLSKCSSEILALDGMTGKKTRHLYNNLLDMPDARYLEIGTWKGSSFCSAIYQNNLKYAFANDNWSQYGGPKEEFLVNLQKFKGSTPVTYIESDYKKLDIANFPKFNVYLFDGGHDFEDHVGSLHIPMNCLDDVFIFIVDDWNWLNVRAGTKLAIEQCDLLVLHCLEVMMTTDNSHTSHEECNNEYWNGVAIFLLQKKSSYRSKPKCTLLTTTEYLPL